jgi:hypothetical protein
LARFRFRLRRGMSYEQWVVDFKYIPQYQLSNDDYMFMMIEMNLHTGGPHIRQKATGVQQTARNSRPIY